MPPIRRSHSGPRPGAQPTARRAFPRLPGCSPAAICRAPLAFRRPCAAGHGQPSFAAPAPRLPQGRPGLDPGPLPACRPPHAPARPPERKPRPPRRPSPPPVGAKPPLGRGGSMPPRAPTRPAPGSARRDRPAPAPCARASRGSETSPASPSPTACCRREAAARPRGLDAPEGAHSPRPGLRPARPSGPRPVRPRFPWVGNVACLALPHRLLSARSRRSAEGARCPRGRQLRAGGGAWAVDILAARAFSRGRALRPSPPVPPPIPDAAPR